ncbi:MAG TPA: tetratricopeptide repeat protein [Blastocatellia bacterium]|nr:tetratricopeptide repeat protein [Blastocatellia bacterium]
MSTLKTASASRKKSARSKRKTDHTPHTESAIEQQGGLLRKLEELSPARVVLLVCLASFLAYANSLGGDFVFDDTEQIVENVDIRSWDNLGKAFTTHVWAFRERPDALRVPTPPPYYRPVFTVLFTVGYHVFGLWPQGWHLMSLLFHILCSVGVFYLIRLVSEKKRVAAVAALIFAVFPVHVESVSWISGVTDPLYGVFFLASFYCYLKFRAGGKRLYLAASILLFVVSAFAKEPGLSLVLLIFVYELLKPGGASALASPGRKEGALRLSFSSLLAAGARALPFFAAAQIYLVARYMVLGGLTWYNPTSYHGPGIHLFYTFFWVVCVYISHILWPVDLSIAYYSSVVTSVVSARFLIPVLLFGGGAFALFRFRSRISREVWFALALIFIPLLPVLDVRQLGVEYLYADRYLYMSVAGYGYLLGLGLAKLAESPNLFGWPQAKRAAISSAALVVLILAYTGATARENLSWRDSYSLWSNTARIRPNSWAAHYNTAIALMDMKRYAEARETLEHTARLETGEACIFDALGRAAAAMGDRDAAIENFRRALALDPEMFESLNNLGTVYFKSGDYEAAEQQFRQALALRPQAVAARFNIALCYSRRGRYEEAVAEFERALDYAPADAEVLYELGLAQQKLGRTAEAESTLRRGLTYSRNQALTDKISEAINGLHANLD